MRLKRLGHNPRNFYVGQKILITCESGIKKETVKKIIPMRNFRKKNHEPYDYEILLDKKNNRYFSLRMVELGTSWVFGVYERY